MLSEDKIIQAVAGSHPEQDVNVTIKVRIIDIEVHSSSGIPHPPHDPGEVIHYRFKVDKQYFERPQHLWTRDQLLALVNATSQTHELFEIGDSGRSVGPHEVVDLRKPGIERFKTVAKEARDGNLSAPGLAVALRQQFEPIAEDKIFLNKQGLLWETLLVSNVGWVLIHNFPLPAGYNIATTTMALMLPSSYPTAEIDMMNFAPAISRRDGRPIANLMVQVVDGQQFQCWSRHRPTNMWRPGIDNLETHVLAVRGWLNHELTR
ncbi:E2/UBC family protein [Hymenobacter bucti]|uniref:E2/UBC family protein n=1 Tax=Hymenobacter bucti TaxID=1844114 RepID=A0ABW4QYB3_9BACT